MAKRGFTLTEILIILAVIAVLAIILLATLDPVEQIRKSRDARAINVAGEILSAVARASGFSGFSIKNDLKGANVATGEGLQTVSVLAEKGELRDGFVENIGSLDRELFLTLEKDFSPQYVCFAPESKSYKTSNLAAYDLYGEEEDCSENTCYICLGATSLAKKAESEENDEGQAVGVVEDPCSNYDPEYPQYPWTCDYSTKWAEYGCTNFCIADKGCGDSYCSSGQRHLVKSYHHAPGSGFDFWNCLLHDFVTKEDYCVSGMAANCEEKWYPSGISDFLWGCTDPRRPYAWQ
jgi:hypothetical protein